MLLALRLHEQCGVVVMKSDRETRYCWRCTAGNLVSVEYFKEIPIKFRCIRCGARHVVSLPEVEEESREALLADLRDLRTRVLQLEARVEEL